MSIFDRIFSNLAAVKGPPDQLMIDSTHLKTHQTAASLLKGGCSQAYRPDQVRAEPLTGR